MLKLNLQKTATDLSSLFRITGTPFLRSLQENFIGLIYYILLGLLAILSVISTLQPFVGQFAAIAFSIFCTACAIGCEFVDLGVVNDSTVKHGNDAKEPSYPVRALQYMIDKLGDMKWLVVGMSVLVAFWRYDATFFDVFRPFMGLVWGQRVASVGAYSAAAYDFIVNYINVEKATLQTIMQANFLEVEVTFDQESDSPVMKADGFELQESIEKDIKLACQYGMIYESSVLTFNAWEAEGQFKYKCVAIKPLNKKHEQHKSDPLDYRILCMMIGFGTMLYVCGDFAILQSVASQLMIAYPQFMLPINMTVALSIVVAFTYQAILWSFNFLYLHKEHMDGKLKFIKDWLGWSAQSRMALLVSRQGLICLTQDIGRSIVSGDFGMRTVFSIASLPLRINAGEAQASTELVDSKEGYVSSA